jgi:RNA polymerase sigma factor (TIGR02999 family)
MDVTELLRAANEGNEDALESLAPMVYDELRWLAHSQLQQEFGPRTLSTTALVNEAYLKLLDGSELPSENRRHFYGVAARAMRQVLVSEARRRGAAKRGSGAVHLSLETSQVPIEEVSAELLALDQALTRLEGIDERLVRIIECRFFGGLTVEETAEVLGLSSRTVKRDWRMARAWLFRELSMDSEGKGAPPTGL